MENLKNFSYFILESESGPVQLLTREQERFLDHNVSGRWKINERTGLIDVSGSFTITDSPSLKDFRGIKFGKVSRDFWIIRTGLKTLEGSPKEVGGEFYVSVNSLTNLDFAPSKVGGAFDVTDNPITDISGISDLASGTVKIAGSQADPLLRFKVGSWNPVGWMRALEEGNDEQVKLLLTLNFFNDIRSVWDSISQDTKIKIYNVSDPSIFNFLGDDERKKISALSKYHQIKDLI